MTAYTVVVSIQKSKQLPIVAGSLQAAIASARATHAGWAVDSVEWKGASAEVYSKCEGCETSCVCVLEDGGNPNGETNYEHSSDGVPLCILCMDALVAAYAAEHADAGCLASGKVAIGKCEGVEFIPGTGKLTDIPAGEPE